MAIAIHGIGLGGGITIGRAYVIDKNLEDATLYLLAENEVDLEIKRFDNALLKTRQELEQLRVDIPINAPAELGAFLSLSIMMLGDSQVSQTPINIIKEELCNVEWALKLQSDRISAKFDEMNDEYLKERKYDILQVLERIFKNLDGNDLDWDSIGKIEEGILVTNDLSPADLLQFKQSKFAGFITEVGSTTSHTAIIGKNLDTPSILGVNYARLLIRANDLIILDGINGVVIINPEPIILMQYQKLSQKWLDTKAKLREIRKKTAETKDGEYIYLYSNIDNLDDIDDARYYYANGIGLFRSEFIFLQKDNKIPDEDEQFEIYAKLARGMKNNIVTIRTADLGADKNPSWGFEHQNHANNPALGLTGVRLSLVEHNFFKTQLRAILRASNYGNIQLMFPMVSSSLELKQAINHLNYAKDELLEENIPFNHNIKIGAMIEVPSSAIAIKSILPHVDFVSIGTNDLIQFLLAIDRNDESVNYLYNPVHPAVLKVLFHVIKTCNKMGKEVSICGEMAGEYKLTRLLLGMGLRHFSMHSNNILNVKNIILNTNIKQIHPIINKIIRTENIERIEELIDELNNYDGNQT